MHDMLPVVPTIPMPVPPPRIAAVFCSHDRVCAGWSYDFAHLVAHFVATGGFVPETGETFSLALNWCQTSILPEGRHRLVEDMYRKGVAKVLWIDTDMRFPKEGLHMLLRHQKPIIGCNYVSRRPPFRFTAATPDERILETKPGQIGIEEAGHIGFGFCLTDLAVYGDPTSSAQEPMFKFEWYWNEEQKRWTVIGEDVSFCREARARGYKVFVDHHLSSAIGHIGEFEYNAEVMQAVEAAPVT